MIRSMCCRLQLDLRELLKRGNGLFGSAEQTGSLGVVTINCARLGYVFAQDEEGLFNRLSYLLDLAATALKLSARSFSAIWIRLVPVYKTLSRTLRNHFSTIGVNGINEMIRNFTQDEEDITTEAGHALPPKCLNFIRDKMVMFQEETGHMYNLEATPAEGTTYRFAKEDKKRFPKILQAGTPDHPTTPTALSCRFLYGRSFEALEMQEDLAEEVYRRHRTASVHE